MGPAPAIAETRLAVRRTIADVPPGATVVVACSGGADSLALLAATVFEARTSAVRVIGVVVDHGLQAGSADHSSQVVGQMAQLGATETAAVRVTVDPGPAGIEAGAREARYAALSRLAGHFSAPIVLLGHTLDDQAESVLLGLARGSGARSLQGMRTAFVEGDVEFRRPFVLLRREQTEAACRADGIEWWDDPHNSDPRFLRSRIRSRVMPELEASLGPGVAEALARTGHQLRDDVEVLDSLTEELRTRAEVPGGLDLEVLAPAARALRTRCLRAAAVAAGAIPTELTYEHILALEALAAGKEVQLPGHLTAYRHQRHLLFRSTR